MSDRDRPPSEFRIPPSRRSSPRQSRGLNRRSPFIVHRSSFASSAFRLEFTRRGGPSAFTLVELLVVIAIIVTVSAIVVPLLTPVLDSRRIRESARIISTQFASAQSEAMAKGRPVGVWIERLGAGDTATNLDRSAAMDLYLCEVPQVYAGDTVNSRVQVAMQSGIAGFKFNTTSDFSWNQTDFLCPGDLIRFDFRGPYYEIVGASSAPNQPNNMVVTPQPSATNPSQQRPYLDPANNQRQQGYQFVPVNKAEFNPTSGLPLYYHLPPTVQNSDQGAVGVTMAYQIFRQPVKSSTQPVQLPAGSVIDLFCSGTASAIPYFGGYVDPQNPANKFTTDRNPIIITFSKSGALDSFYMMGQKYPLVEPIHFLLGQREKLPHVTYNPADPLETQADKHNFRDLENLWISINPQTGLITTAEMASVQDSSFPAPTSQGDDSAALKKAIPLSRQFATSAQTMGGR